MGKSSSTGPGIQATDHTLVVANLQSDSSCPVWSTRATTNSVNIVHLYVRAFCLMWPHVMLTLTLSWTLYPTGSCSGINIRDAKSWKVSGNFGNFPWKVSGILKGWEFSEILGIFNFDLFSTFYEIVCTKVNRIKISLHYIQTHLSCTTFLTVYWPV